jgi:DNA-binding MarR family transcriptional regulator
MEYQTGIEEGKEPLAEGRLIYTVSAIMRKVSDRALASWGLTVAQAPVLVILREAGRPVMITKVARRLLLETPSVTTMVDRLTERGLVERVKDPKDRRKTLVALTKKGRRLVDSIREPGQQLEEEMFAVLNEGERDSLKTILEKWRDGNIGRIE